MRAAVPAAALALTVACSGFEAVPLAPAAAGPATTATIRAAREDPPIGSADTRAGPEQRDGGAARDDADDGGADANVIAGPVVRALDVPGFLPAVVVVPSGRRAPRPLLVATHGAGGTPEEHCRRYAAIVAGRAFILCPRGRPLGRRDAPAGYFYPNHLELGRELRSALDALARALPGEVDLHDVVYAGFSQGATMGALAIGLHPEPFTRLALVEGGFSEWDLAAARRFHAAGGARVLFACGRPVCADGARQSARWLEREGIATRLVDARGAGHTWEGAVGEGVRDAFSWLVEGDPRWDE